MLAKGSVHIIALPFVAATILVWLVYFLLAILCICIGIILLIFFRDPKRQTASGIVAAADGKIREISGDSQTVMISTFMNVHDVHVNRVPFDGKVLSIERIKGTFKPAFLTGAAENSRVVTVLDTGIGEIKIVQIAGIFAWRIVPYISVGQELKKGDKLGMIRFGSRVDVHLPRDKVTVAVESGQHVKANSTTIARLNS